MSKAHRSCLKKSNLPNTNVLSNSIFADVPVKISRVVYQISLKSSCFHEAVGVLIKKRCQGSCLFCSNFCISLHHCYSILSLCQVHLAEQQSNYQHDSWKPQQSSLDCFYPVIIPVLITCQSLVRYTNFQHGSFILLIP